MKKYMLIFALLLAMFLAGCMENVGSPSCISDEENVKCEITKDGTATLSKSDLPSNAVLTSAKISPCEITGRLWSCEEINLWKVKNCEILSSSQPFKVKCPIEAGAWSVKFTILKPKACRDSLDPNVLRDCEEIVRIYQKI